MDKRNQSKSCDNFKQTQKGQVHPTQDKQRDYLVVSRAAVYLSLQRHPTLTIAHINTCNHASAGFQEPDGGLAWLIRVVVGTHSSFFLGCSPPWFSIYASGCGTAEGGGSSCANQHLSLAIVSLNHFLNLFCFKAEMNILVKAAPDIRENRHRERLNVT